MMKGSPGAVVMVVSMLPEPQDVTADVRLPSSASYASTPGSVNGVPTLTVTVSTTISPATTVRKRPSPVRGRR